MGRRPSQINVVRGKVSVPLVLLVLFVGLTVLVNAINQFGTSDQLPLQQTRRESDSKPNIHPSHFYSKIPFEEVLTNSIPVDTARDKEVLGGIIPHHLLAAPLIADFFRSIEIQEVRTVAILGPDHRNIGDYPISLSQAEWETPYGILKPNLPVISGLLENTAAGVDEDIFRTEHAIYNITPFVKKTFPNAHIVPITFGSGTTHSQAEGVARALMKILSDKSLVIAAVDFSHAVSPSRAQEQDQRSLEIISEFSLDQIDSLETDSNAAILTLLSYLEEKGANDAFFVDRADSSEMSQNPSLEEVTSYAAVYFAKEEPPNPALSLGVIFNRQQPLRLPASSQPFTVIVTGDVNLGRSVNVRIRDQEDSVKLFTHIKDLLQSADLTLINLESPLINNCPMTNEGMKLCGRSSNAQQLKDAGVDIASLANNHAEDYGNGGLQQTKSALSENNVESLGHGEIRIVTIDGIRVAVLAYDIVWHAVNTETLQSDLTQASGQADLVIVFFHWGNEYTVEPSNGQRKFAYLAIDNGADLVVGNHPHWVQAIEVYHNRLIVYSHGNFVFDQLWSDETREGVIGRYTFSREEILQVEIIPIWINEYFQPTLAQELRQEKILNRMEEASLRLVKRNW